MLQLGAPCNTAQHCTALQCELRRQCSLGGVECECDGSHVHGSCTIVPLPRRAYCTTPSAFISSVTGRWSSPGTDTDDTDDVTHHTQSCQRSVPLDWSVNRSVDTSVSGRLGQNGQPRHVVDELSVRVVRCTQVRVVDAYRKLDPSSRWMRTNYMLSESMKASARRGPCSDLCCSLMSDIIGHHGQQNSRPTCTCTCSVGHGGRWCRTSGCSKGPSTDPCARDAFIDSDSMWLVLIHLVDGSSFRYTTVAFPSLQTQAAGDWEGAGVDQDSNLQFLCSDLLDCIQNGTSEICWMRSLFRGYLIKESGLGYIVNPNLNSVKD